MNMGTNIVLSQGQQLSQMQLQVMIQSLQLLSLSNISLHESLQKEFYENPFMEYRPPCSDKKDTSFLNYVSAPEKEPVKHFILEQLNPWHFSKTEWSLLKYLSGCVDTNGFFAIKKEDLLQAEPFSRTSIEKCLRVLRQLEPAGICTFSLEECLLEQLRRKDLLSNELCHIIQFHLKDIAQNNAKTITASVHISGKELQKYIKIIRSLNPAPLNGLFSERSSYIIPDIIIMGTEKDISIQLNDTWMGTYSMNDYYVTMIKKSQNSTMKDYYKTKYTHCSLMIQNIEQRRKTLLLVSQALWDWQKDFFIKKLPLRKMTLKDIAYATNLNSSTVSRAIKGKYLQYPKGTIALKDLFQHGYTQGKIPVSQNSIKTYLKQLVSVEDPINPYSDSKLSEKLSLHFKQSISRRAITKYRSELNIANSFSRKIL